MKSLIRSTIVIATLILSAQTGSACYCVTPEAPEAFARAGAVFVGQVVEIVEPRTDDPDAPLPGRLFVIKFKVERSWKGADFNSEIEVLSAQGRYGCFAHSPVSIGERHLIYADLWNGWLSIYSCSRTALISDPIKPGALRSKPWPLTTGRAYRSWPAWENGIDTTADLQLLESLLHPTFQFNFKPGKESFDNQSFLNLREPGPKHF